MKTSRVFLTVAFAILLLSGCSKSYRNSVSHSNTGYSEQRQEGENSVPDEEGAAQEPAWTYFEKLSYLFGADSTCVGMTDDMNFPGWYSGCFVNDRNRLTINVIGDTLEIRETLAKQLGGNEFDLGVGVCLITEQIKTRQLLKEAIAQKYDGDLTYATKADGTIEVCLQGDNDSVISRFKREVFDSPILRFKLSDKIGIVELVNQKTDNSQDELYSEYETAPQFPGGDASMLSYINDNLAYPREAYDEDIQGRVVMQFLVRKTGEVDSIKISRGKDPSLDAEAIRLVSGFPRFTPATSALTPVDRWITLPIKFSITDYDERQRKRYPAFRFENGDDYVVDGMYRIVDEQGRMGYADEQGNTVITPRFKCAFPFDNGRAKVADTGTNVYDGTEHWHWESNDWYYIDKTGRKID